LQPFQGVARGWSRTPEVEKNVKHLRGARSLKNAA
jgi:hypothetical protein